jgi:LmbE family N-acetylglucosaminyl deacetylase
MKSVVFIVAHPDDVAFGMGGTALLLSQKYKIHVLCATKGELGRGGRDIPMAEVAAYRSKEEEKATEFLKGELTFLGKIDQDVFADEATCREVAEYLKERDPAAVFSMWPSDTHSDHCAVAEITRKAIRFSGLSPELYCCEESTIVGQTTHFSPDIYVDISPVVEEKLAMLRCHESQNREDHLAQNMLKQCKFRGGEAGLEYAEGFKSRFKFTNKTKSILFTI